ncbi:hypothetical protein [Deefgea salmonis]|uniref:Uncharacterized protein n=1 Tax=Deefgea salmonis TaxID=2875502 RepID=A0ABS8BN23_9NEIS|nr:hypothetical protein [Deefgea salmonis]MCB5197133.1 hypothetical protein [Deefgea salmonis]
MTTLRASCLASGQNPRKRGWQTKRQQTLGKNKNSPSINGLLAGELGFIRYVRW